MSSLHATALRGRASSGPTYFVLRRLHSLTGIMFGGYLIVHLLVNATIAQGGDIYQLQVNKIHGLPFLPVVEWTFIFLPLLYHTVYGTWVILTGQPNSVHYPYGKNWFYLLQRISAVIIVLFIAFHVLALKYGLFGTNLAFVAEDKAMVSVAQHFHTSRFIAYVVYPIGILASCFHLANGIWAAAITWGLTISAAAQRRWGYVCVVLFSVTFAAGMIANVAAVRLPPGEATRLVTPGIGK